MHFSGNVHKISDYNISQNQYVDAHNQMMSRYHCTTRDKKLDVKDDISR